MGRFRAQKKRHTESYAVSLGLFRTKPPFSPSILPTALAGLRRFVCGPLQTGVACHDSSCSIYYPRHLRLLWPGPTSHVLPLTALAPHLGQSSALFLLGNWTANFYP